MDYKFTAKLEDELDKISNGTKTCLEVLKEFYNPFGITVKNLQDEFTKNKLLKKNQANQANQANQVNQM